MDPELLLVAMTRLGPEKSVPSFALVETGTRGHGASLGRPLDEVSLTAEPSESLALIERMKSYAGKLVQGGRVREEVRLDTPDVSGHFVISYRAVGIAGIYLACACGRALRSQVAQACSSETSLAEASRRSHQRWFIDSTEAF